MAVIGLFVLVGVSLGLLGGGGSILTVPLLVYVAGLDAKSAVAMSLLVVALTSAFGLIPYLRRGHVDARVALVFAPVSMLGAFGGGGLARYFSDTALMVLFALMMLVTSAAMLRRPVARPLQERTGARRTGLLALEGALVGMFTGLVGAGGGFMVVPALVLFAKLEMRRAVGTSLVIIVLKSLAGLAGHLSHVAIDWSLAFAHSGAAAGGALLGAVLASRIPAQALRGGFGVFVLLMGVLVLFAQLPSSALDHVRPYAGILGVVILVTLAVVALGLARRVPARRSRLLGRAAESGR